MGRRRAPLPSPAPDPAPPPFGALARTWLAEKRISARSPDPRNSEAARIDDLCRMARHVVTVAGEDAPTGPFDLDVDLDAVPFARVDRDLMVKAMGSLQVALYSANTRARTLSTWRQFTRWLTRRGVLAVDPCDELSVAAPSNMVLPAGKFFTRDEIDRLVHAATHPDAAAWSAWPARDVAIVELLAGCGPRAQEVASLQVRSLDCSLEHPMLRLTAGVKGGKPRNVPIPRRTLAAVDAYLGERRARAVTDPDWGYRDTSALFVRARRDGTVDAINRLWLYRLVERLTAAAGVPMKPDAAVHAFRHAFGVELARRRVSPWLLQELLGHADPRTTAGYTRFTGDLAVEGLEAAGWL